MAGSLLPSGPVMDACLSSEQQPRPLDEAPSPPDDEAPHTDDTSRPPGGNLLPHLSTLSLLFLGMAFSSEPQGPDSPFPFNSRSFSDHETVEECLYISRSMAVMVIVPMFLLFTYQSPQLCLLQILGESDFGNKNFKKRNEI